MEAEGGGRGVGWREVGSGEEAEGSGGDRREERSGGKRMEVEGRGGEWREAEGSGGRRREVEGNGGKRRSDVEGSGGEGKRMGVEASGGDWRKAGGRAEGSARSHLGSNRSASHWPLLAQSIALCVAMKAIKTASDGNAAAKRYLAKTIEVYENIVEDMKPPCTVYEDADIERLETAVKQTKDWLDKNQHARDRTYYKKNDDLEALADHVIWNCVKDPVDPQPPPPQ